MADQWSLVALAVVSQSNKPLMSQLFLSDSATPQDELSLQFLLHSSLDVCDERVESRLRLNDVGRGAVVFSSSSGTSGAAGSTRASGAGSGDTGSNIARTSPMTYTDPNNQHACFLDKLLQSGRYWTWGHQSNSGVRVIAVTFGEPPKEVMRPLLKATYESVSAALCNPFRDHDAPLDSNSFLRKVTELVTKHTIMGQRLMEM